MSYELHFMRYELNYMSYELHFTSYELHFMSYISEKCHIAIFFKENVDITCIIIIIIIVSWQELIDKQKNFPKTL